MNPLAGVNTTFRHLIDRIERPLRWTLAVFLSAVALHVDRLPAWCLLAVVALAGWRAAWSLGRAPPPSAALRTLAGASLIAAVIVKFGGVSGLAAGTALLTCMGALKLLETRARRDHVVVIGAALFLILAACLDRQALWRMPLYAGVVWLTCAALAIVTTPDTRLSATQVLRLSGKTLGWALPLALVAFLLFPRLQGQVWALPGSGSGVTGLSEEMTPGAIGELSESDEPAFRVRFEGTPPPAGQLYWRGPVLHQFDGYTWRRDPGALYRQIPLQYLGPAYRYRVTLEPHQQRWWFALDLPVGAPRPGVRFTHDYQLLSDQPVTQPTTYDAVSHLQTRSLEPLTVLARKQSLRLPSGRNLRSVALARQLRVKAADDAAFVSAVLDLFRNGGFTYSLTPPKLDLNSVDDFLFRTRTGFCGHYASALVTLLRAADIPARVVTGYQGGEWNPIGGYLIVRQSDAHAWAEVWIAARGGWVRVDPTGVVSPGRLTRGFLGGFVGAAAQTGRMLAEIGWITRTRMTWDAANTWWKDRVVEFDLRDQLSLLARLGFQAPGIETLRQLLLAALLVWLAWVGLRFGRAHRNPPAADSLGQSYRQLCRRISRAGLPRATHEGPQDYARRIAATRPQLAARVVPLLARYTELRFAGRATLATVADFRSAVRGLRALR